ncbi:MAG: 30S ribosomal protein S24e [Candidatus Bathyarchaeum sp.]|nr:MAG: 30S ribosomal protein S24e [Candidatus Bathyarchaeum sp.]
MKVNIISKEQNPLLKRREVKFCVDHSDMGGTPSRVQVSKQLASMLSAKSELVFVKNMTTKTGSMSANGEATVYDTMEQAKLMEPQHVLDRNKAPEKPEESKAPEEQPKEETSEEA